MKKKAAGGPKSWRAGSATEVRRAVVRFGASERKLRLHAVACCRLVGDQITHPDCVALVELIERRADADSLAAAQTKLRTAVGAGHDRRRSAGRTCGSLDTRRGHRPTRTSAPRCRGSATPAGSATCSLRCLAHAARRV
ncbi:hypothetical protein R5W23_000694 [Gemmata sp. JC673]|uniref:Uncharacterized protein n=1 Tax=Gemmata algarum TaxID=2975278 RepID=A0ABU5EWX3_9BACT|nr:hypothetical protein [Gemmata algarum]MDY3559681.1 hypothetical protein [Gemmata algarum]